MILLSGPKDRVLFDESLCLGGLSAAAPQMFVTFDHVYGIFRRRKLCVLCQVDQ